MKLFSIITFTALALTGAVQAAEETAKPPENKPVDVGGASDMERVGAPATAYGKITSIYNSKLVDVNEPHLIVKLESDQGEIEIVDLGSAEDLKKGGIEPVEGKQLWVEGKVGRINDKPLVFAENVSETKMVSVVRTSPLREETVKHAAARTDGKDPQAGSTASEAKKPKVQTIDAGMLVRTVEGTVMNTRKVKIEGEAEEHMLAKLQTDEGIAVVDLGMLSTLPKVDLTEGQSIAATGFVGRLNDKPVIFADSVGNLTSIQRKPVPTAAPITK